MVAAESFDEIGKSEVTSASNESSALETIDILGNGLVEKKMLRKGLGQDSRPNHGDSVVISYKGWLEDGTLVEEVDNLSIVIGDGECIHAFDLALPLAELKEEFELITDSQFAYGDKGKLPEIPEKAKLIYHVTLNECGDPPNYGKMQIKDRFSIADRRRNRGNFYFHRDEFQYALTCYTKALEILLMKLTTPMSPPVESATDDLNPTCTPELIADLEIKLKNNIAATQLKLEAYEAAAKTCDAVLQIDPLNRKALYRKGLALTYSEDYPEAIEVFTEALRLDPRSNLVRLALQRAKTAWKVQRDRQIRALSRAFKVNGVTENKLQKSGVGFWSRYKVAISAVALASFSVIIGGTILHLSSQH